MRSESNVKTVDGDVSVWHRRWSLTRAVVSTKPLLMRLNLRPDQLKVKQRRWLNCWLRRQCVSLKERIGLWDRFPSPASNHLVKLIKRPSVMVTLGLLKFGGGAWI